MSWRAPGADPGPLDRHGELTVRRGRHDARGEYIRGTITSWNLTMQKLLPHPMSVTVGYVANRQIGITRTE